MASISSIRTQVLAETETGSAGPLRDIPPGPAKAIQTSPSIGANLRSGPTATGSSAEPATEARRDRSLRLMRRILREPLLHFAVIGLAILLAASAWRTAHDARRIVFTPDDAATLVQRYQLQYGVVPKPDQLEALIQAQIQEDVLYREGVALGIDKNDEVVRRRVAQKAQFLQQDLSAPPEPTAPDLEAYYDAHQAVYADESRTTFRQVFFSPDHDGDEGARRRAQLTLANLSGRPNEAVVGDPLPDPSVPMVLSAGEARQAFGDSEMAHRLADAPVGRWLGPYRSGYGWHLIFVRSREPGRIRPLTAVREQVRTDYLRDSLAAANTRAMSQLMSRYTIVRTDRTQSGSATQ